MCVLVIHLKTIDIRWWWPHEMGMNAGGREGVK